MEKCETKTVRCDCGKKCKTKGFESVLGAGMLEKSGDNKGTGDLKGTGAVKGAGAGLGAGDVKCAGAGLGSGDELEEVKKLSIRELIRNINYNNSLIKSLKADLEAYKKQLIELMKCKGVDKYMSKSVSVSYIPSNVSYVFNAKEFKEMQSDLYKEFLTKRKEVGESVRISERK